MSEAIPPRRAARFFTGVLRARWPIVGISLFAIVVAAAFLPRLVKDTRMKAYTPANHPARVAMDRVKEVFGLSESVIVAVITDRPEGVFAPGTLNLIRDLTEEILEIPGVDPDRVTSLATEKNILGTADGMTVEPFYEGPVHDAVEAKRIRDAVMDFDLYVGTLVSKDGKATLIFVELLDERYGASVYNTIRTLTDDLAPNGVDLHVAGLGAYNALIGDYIDSDLRHLNPITAAVILLMLIAAYRTVRGVVLPGLIVAGSVAIAYGAMAAAGIPVYGVTSSMSVILIAIGVCDGIHILGQYYTEQARRAKASADEVVVATMVEMWRPVLITSVTSIMGFLALSSATDMPPMRWYGVFASLGVAAALLLSLFALPAVLASLPLRGSPAIRPEVDSARSAVEVDRFGRATARLGALVSRRPRAVLASAGVLVLVGAVGASGMERDNDLVAYLNSWEPLHRAELAINRTLGGIQTLDIVVDASRVEGLFDPEVLRRIDALQRRIEELPRVLSTRSLVDYVKQMHRVMNDGDPRFYAIPDDPNLIAQYFLIYSATGDPSDLEQVVDYEFRMANVRVAFDRTRWSDARTIIPATQEFIEEYFDENGTRVSLAGWLNVAHENDVAIGKSQRLGVALAFVAVWLGAAVCFRSWRMGVLASLPVVIAVLLVYAAMGVLGIWLNFATSMTATIAIGLSIDFSVHTIDRLRDLVGRHGLSLDQAFLELFPSTGRALLFNFACVFFGFSVLTSSAIPTVREFGILAAVCVAASFIGSVTLVPALVKVLKPRAILDPAPTSRTFGPIAGREG